jgi:hypothetical protein
VAGSVLNTNWGENTPLLPYPCHCYHSTHILPSIILAAIVATRTNPQGLVARFVAEGQMWSWAVSCVAELDALMSLAAHALGSETEMCRPKVSH